MASLKTFVIAAKDDIFDSLFKQSTRKQEWPKDDEAAVDTISDSYRELSKQIEALGVSLYGPEKAQKYFYDSLDCYPNYTRYIEASFDGFTQEYYDGLRDLLTGPYHDWRIQIIVYADICSGRTMFGSMAIWHDRLLIDRPLYAALYWRGFHFGFEGEAIWASPDKPYPMQP